MTTTPKQTDVLIIGGGPGGTTFGTLIRKSGFDVTLLEKTEHPRFHIGESLLPMNLPILERLGVLGAVKEIGVPKPGADFTLGNSEAATQTFYFREALGDSPGHAFEVRRSEFDELLFRNCQEAGVDARENFEVTSVSALPKGKHRVVARDNNGDEHVWETRFLVDASGRDALLSSRNGWKKKNPRHASAAVYGHFGGVVRRPNEDQGNISLYWFDHGWIWMIPLRDDVMSIGAVCYPEYLKSKRGSLDEFLLRALNSVPDVNERLKNARALIPASATGNYSYSSSRMTGAGYSLVGDAYAFIDPVFSSGVYLAMNGAERAVPLARAWLSGNRLRYRFACWHFNRETRRGLKAFSWFIYRFTSPVMGNLMSNPRNVLKVVQAVVSMLAGDVYKNREVRLRLLVFKFIYAVSWMIHWRDARAERSRRLRSVRANES